MSIVHAPTFLYPNGGETLSVPVVTVKWIEPLEIDQFDSPAWYELYYTDDFDSTNEPNWIAIATVPATVTQFVWRISKNISTKRCRLGIRTRTGTGLKSSMTISAANITVNRRTLPTPRFVSPASGGRYNTSVPIVVSTSEQPDRTYYQLYYSSASAGVPMTAISQNVLVRDMPVHWAVSELTPATDYILYATVVDADGNTSEIVQVSNIEINHEGSFIVDTLPPSATVKLQGGNVFTNTRSISVSVYAEDAATASQAMQLKDNGSPQKPNTNVAYRLSSGDGVKNVEALLQDFGGNRNSDVRVEPPLLNALPLVGSDVVDFTVAYDGGETTIFSVTTGSSRGLYKTVLSPTQKGFPTRVKLISGEPTSVGNYLGEAYVAVMDSDNYGRVYKPTTTGWNEEIEFDIGVFVNDMQTFDGKLYLGTNTGHLYSYDGSDIVLITDENEEVTIDGDLLDWEFGRPPVKKMKVTSGKLYISFKNSNILATYDGTTLRYMEI